MEQGRYNLPPGFRFHPTDEELVVHFLYRRAALLPCHPDIIPDIDLYHCDPWELNGRALAGDKHWYFFSHWTKDRITPNGYWKHTVLDEPITSASNTVGLKKSLVFYIGEPPMGIKTDWLMDEYHLLDYDTSNGSSSKRRKKKIVSKEWVICRVYETSCGAQASFCNDEIELSCLDEVFLSLDDLDEVTLPN